MGTPSGLPTRLASDRLPFTKTDANGGGRASCPARDKPDYVTAGLLPISRLGAGNPNFAITPANRRSFHRPGSLRRRPRLGPTSPLSPNGDSHAATTMLTRKNERKNASA